MHNPEHYANHTITERWPELHHKKKKTLFARIKTFYLCTCYCDEKTKSSWKCSLPAWRTGKPPPSPLATTSTCSERFINTLIRLHKLGCLFVWISVLSIVAGWFVSLSAAWRGRSDCRVGRWVLAELPVPHLSCFLWSVLHFSLVCFALELSILE